MDRYIGFIDVFQNFICSTIYRGAPDDVLRDRGWEILVSIVESWTRIGNDMGESGSGTI